MEKKSERRDAAALLVAFNEFVSYCGLNHAQRFERDAEAFYETTHMLAPGRSSPMEAMIGSGHARRAAWDEWCARRNRERVELLQDVAALATSAVGFVQEFATWWEEAGEFYYGPRGRDRDDGLAAFSIDAIALLARRDLASDHEDVVGTLGGLVATARNDGPPQFNADKTRYIKRELLGWVCYQGQVDAEKNFRGERVGVATEKDEAERWLAGEDVSLETLKL